MRNFSLPLDITIKKRVHHNGAARVRKQLAAQADQTAAGHTKLDAHAAIAVIVHIYNFALAGPELFHHHSDKFFGYVYGESLNRLHQLAIYAFGDNLRFTNHELVAF